MEQISDAAAMLDLMDRPAFCVKEGTISHINQAAQGRMVELGAEISEMLVTGRQEYADFTGGCLYLSLSVSGQVCGASVTRMNGLDIFLLEQEADHAELQAMALAAQELRGPLTGVMAVSDRLFPSVAADGNPVMCEQIARMNRGLFQLLRIIGNMSDAARYCAEASASLETRDICAILDEVFAKASALVEHTDIRLRFSNLPGKLYCLVDGELLERAVYNILSNAVKFTPKGGTIDAKLTRRGNKLYLSVQDSGQGIPNELRGSVYSRYLRAPAIEDGRFGIGLGLVLIRSAAALHGGTVLMEQPEGAGTKITMTLEIRQRQDGVVHSPVFKVDYAGERDHGLIELSGVLPSRLYEKEKVN